MSDFILGERRRQPRWAGDQLPPGFTLLVLGVRIVEILDASPAGARLRVLTPLRPGRTAIVRLRGAGEGGERQFAALVLRCWVHRLGRTGVVYDAGLSWDVGKPP